MSLKSIIQNDIQTVFLADAEEFADALKIGTSSTNYVSTFGSLQSNLIDNNATSAAPLQSFSDMLLVATAAISALNLRTGQTVYINDVPYKITTMSDEMGISNIGLKKGV